MYRAESERAVTKSQLEQAFESDLSRKACHAEKALAIPAQHRVAPDQRGLFDAITWINGQPPSLCVHTEHRIGEIHKLKWTMLLMGNAAADPKARHFPTFFTHYRSVSRMKDHTKCLDIAAGHFAQLMEHGGFVGNPSKSVKDSLKKCWQGYLKDNDDRFIEPGLCFECNAEIPEGVEGQIYTPLGVVVV